MKLLFVIALIACAQQVLGNEQGGAAVKSSKERIVFNLSSQRSLNSFPVHHHVKWITNQTRFPVKMSVQAPVGNASDVFELAWERSTDKKLIHTLPELNRDYAIAKEEAKSTLMLLKYNNETNEQLGSYEPRLIVNGQLVDRNQTASILKERNVYTLARLTQHKISIKKLMNKNKISCIADFLVSNSEQESVESIMMLMEKYASFKLAIQSKAKVRNSVNKRPSQVFPQQQQQQHPLPLQPQNVQQQAPIQMNIPPQMQQPQQQVQQAPQQVVVPPQPAFQNVQPHLQQQPHVQQVPDLSQIQQQHILLQQQQQMQQHLLQQQQQQQQHQQQQQQYNWNMNIPQQYNSNPYYNQHPYMQMPASPLPAQQQQVPYAPYPGLIDESYLMFNNYQPEQSREQQKVQPIVESLDNEESSSSPSPVPETMAESIEQRQQRLLQNVYFTQHSQRYKQFFPESQASTAQASFMSPDNWFNYKNKRSVSTAASGGNSNDSAEEAASVVEQQSADVEDVDYDESRFVKIRLTLGPVTLFRPILTDEVVSCSLDLINIDDSTLDYKSTVYMKLPEWMDPVDQRRIQEALSQPQFVYQPKYMQPLPLYRPPHQDKLSNDVAASPASSHSDALRTDQNTKSQSNKVVLSSSSSPMITINPFMATLATLCVSILVHLF